MTTHAHIDDETGLDDLDPSTTQSRDATFLRRIRAAQADVDSTQAELRRVVAEARDAGESWTVIGAALDTTRQAAYQRFGR